QVAVSRALLQRLDEMLDAYQKSLIGWVGRIPLAQLRASLSTDSHAQRVEASALLQICLESEAVPKRLLHIVDFLITLLSAGRRGGGRLYGGIDGDLGLFAPLQGDDPRSARPAREGGLAAHESPGVIAVAEAIRRRLIDDVVADGPAERLAGALDLGLLEEADR